MIIETSTFGNFEQVEEPRVLIIPVPYEHTTNFVKGTKLGPQSILNGSVYLSSFDDELWSSVNNLGINTLNFIKPEFVDSNSSQPFVEVEQAVRDAVVGGSLPVIIGGEHSISYGAIKAIYDLYPDVSILHFGAHVNMKSSVKNNKFNHSCMIQRIVEVMPELKIVQIGIRNIFGEEAAWLDKVSPNVEMFFARDKNKWNVADIISNLTKNVYITFDFSAFDSGIMPSTSKPEPGGLSWDLVVDILKNVCTFKEVVGMDFVELSPIKDLDAPNYLAAKLVYKTIGYTFARELGAFEEGESSLVASE